MWVLNLRAISIISEHPKKFFLIGIVCLLVIIILFPYSSFFAPTIQENKTSNHQVAVINQFPKQDNFTNRVVELFEEENIEVDVYENVTVNLYRKLPELDYKLIIFRVHSALSPKKSLDFVSPLYTNEKYKSSKYPVLQSKNYLVPARTQEWNESKAVFAITPKFIEEKMKGKFNDTLIILDSCHTICPTSNYMLPKAFYKKGAKAVIGWKGKISLEYGDKVTLNLLDHALSDNKTLLESAKITLTEIESEEYENNLIIPQAAQNLLIKKQDDKLILKEK